MKWFYLGLCLISLNVSAQSFLEQMKSISEKASETEIDNFLESKKQEAIPGEFLAQMLPKNSDNELCSEPQEPKDTRYEVILIASANSNIGKEEVLERQEAVYASEFYQKMSPLFLNMGEFSDSSVERMSEDYWNVPGVKTEGKIDYKSKKGQEFFVESLIQGAAHSGLSEKEMIGRMTSIIEKHYQTEEEKLNLLSALSSRFYRNYNDARNPGKNNSKFNPENVKLPESNISFVDMVKAAAEFDELSGGVCNDITETIAKVGEKLFPDKDILAVNAGTHFGLAVVDGEKTRIIDGGTNINYQNELKLRPDLTPSNLRISKVKDGVLREIAVTDTKMGQLTEAVFDTGKQLLKTDADISSLVAHYKKKNHGVSVGTSQFDDSNVLVVVAKYQTSSEKWSKNVGVGFSGQDFKGSDVKTKYQVHLRAGAERRMFQYVNDRTRINYHLGGRMSGMYTLNPDNSSEGINVVDFSAALDITNRISMENKSRDGSLNVKSYVEVENTLGVRNWGAMNGILSQKDSSKLIPILKNTSLHLNQINADVLVTKNLNDKHTLVGNAHYQGSNVGQKVDVMAGLNITAPEGAEILVFTGYTNSDLKGYDTQSSIIAGPTGFNSGVKYKKKNLEVSGGVRGIAGETPMVNGTLKINLGKKRR